ncbi:MAG TPA: hypothetical protein GX528_04595 [Firmicutes bacterium]|nr:hypothetical protein [Bacillota bacterium]
MNELIRHPRCVFRKLFGGLRPNSPLFLLLSAYLLKNPEKTAFLKIGTEQKFDFEKLLYFLILRRLLQAEKPARREIYKELLAEIQKGQKGN